MDLSPRETTDLAAFFARRFPDRHALDRLARTAGIDLADTLAGDVQTVWSTVILEASVQGRLRKLARTIAAEDASDENLQEVCALILRSERRPLGPVLAVAGVVAVALVAVAGLVLVGGGEDAAVVQEAPAQVAEAAPAPVAAPVVEEAPAVQAAPEAPAEASPEAPAEAPIAVAAAAPPPEPVPEPTAAPAPRAASVVSTAHAAAPTGCDGAPGQVVGYWYAGSTSPGTKGQVITMDQAVNVRADYPDKHNGYDARTPVQCTLGAGSRFELKEAPIQVPGDAYWVPLVAGSRLSD